MLGRNGPYPPIQVEFGPFRKDQLLKSGPGLQCQLDQVSPVMLAWSIYKFDPAKNGNFFGFGQAPIPFCLPILGKELLAKWQSGWTDFELFRAMFD